MWRLHKGRHGRPPLQRAAPQRSRERIDPIVADVIIGKKQPAQGIAEGEVAARKRPKPAPPVQQPAAPFATDSLAPPLVLADYMTSPAVAQRRPLSGSSRPPSRSPKPLKKAAQAQIF